MQNNEKTKARKLELVNFEDEYDQNPWFYISRMNQRIKELEAEIIKIRDKVNELYTKSHSE